jgi:hypothetical protein
MTESLDPTGTIGRIAAFGLPDTDDGPFTVSDDRWSDLWNGLRTDRLGGLAVAALDAGTLRLPEDRAGEIVGRHRDDMVRCLALEQTLLELADAFDRAGVDLVVLKGPALAHSMYPDPSWRPFFDIDLLVQTSQWRTACRILEDRGITRRLPEPRPGFDERFGKAAVHVTPGGLEVDLHRTLVVGPYGLWMRPDELFARTAIFRLGGRPLRRLDDTGLLMHACVHAALGQQAPFAQQLRDVQQVVAAGTIEVATLEGWAHRWHLGPVVRRAFELDAEATAAAWPTWLRPLMKRPVSERDRGLLSAYASERRSRGGTAVATLRAIPGLRPRLAYGRALAFPDSEFLRRRNGSGGARGHLARLSVPLRWLGRRRRHMTG